MKVFLFFLSLLSVSPAFAAGTEPDCKGFVVEKALRGKYRVDTWCALYGDCKSRGYGPPVEVGALTVKHLVGATQSAFSCHDGEYDMLELEAYPYPVNGRRLYRTSDGFYAVNLDGYPPSETDIPSCEGECFEHWVRLPK